MDHEYESVTQMRGSMCQAHYGDPLAFERANYMNALVSYHGPHVLTPGDQILSARRAGQGSPASIVSN